MKKTLEQALLDKILYVGETIPEGLFEDTRPKFILLGTPQQLIDSVEIKEPTKKIVKEAKNKP